MLIAKLLYGNSLSVEKRQLPPPWCHQTLAPFHLWLLFSCLIPDLSLSSAHWRWGLHLSTHWAPICFWIIWDPDILLVTNLTWAGFVCTLLFTATTGSLELFKKVRKSEQIWDAPHKMFHGQSSDAGMFFSLFRWPQNRFRVMFMSPPVQGRHMCSDQSWHTQWRLCLSFEPRNSTWEQQKLLGFQKSAGSQATYYFENLSKKAKCIQNICYYLLRYDW